MADGTLKVGHNNKRAQDLVTIAIGQSGVTVAMANGSITFQ